MPELPEVETVKRGIAPFVTAKTIEAVVVRDRRLRWPVTRGIDKHLAGQTIEGVERRGKYLLLKTRIGALLIHLGMSGRLRIVSSDLKPAKHDHVDIVFAHSSRCLRFTDPRRFGAILWVGGDPMQHKLLSSLGPEPLGKSFTGTFLFKKSRKRSVLVKSFIMDSHIVVGVGNIYANEALFLSGIKPSRQAGDLEPAECEQLVSAIKQVLRAAIKAGGTTLRDYVSAEGESGYFQQALLVYGRGGEPCPNCGELLQEIRIAQRSTVYCPRCQN